MTIERNHTFRLLLILALTQVLPKCVSLNSACLAEPVQERGPSAETPIDKFELPAAPEPFADLRERGKVEFEFYDKAIASREFPAETRFDFRLTYSFRYTFDIRQADGKRAAVVKPQLEDLNIVCINKIFLPTDLRGENFWNEWLVAHEFEHVRLNCDARPRLLAEYLLKQIKRFEQPLEDDAAVDKEKIKAAFAASIQKIRVEVVRIIQANNDYLDELTRHGVQKLEDPESFFAELYTAENLAKYKFAYLEEVRTLLKSQDYREPE